MPLNRRLMAVLLLLLALPLTAACGAKKSDMTVKLMDFAFDPDEIHLRVGQTYKVNLANEGSVVHDFSVPDVGFDSRDIAPGENKLVELKFAKAGEYKLVCTVPGHEVLGMVGKIVVTE